MTTTTAKKTRQPQKDTTIGGLTRAQWAERAVPWSEDVKYNGGMLVVEAKSYQAWVDNLSPETVDRVSPEVGPDPDWLKEHALRVGEYYLYANRLPYRTYCNVSRFARLGLGFGPVQMGWDKTKLNMFHRGTTECHSVTFTSSVTIPGLFKPNGEVWMSLTPMEVVTLRSGVKRCKGVCLMGGLGMGWMAMRAMARKQVKKLVVVEKDPAIIEHFGRKLWGMPGAEKLEIREGDFYETADKFGGCYDAVVADIWRGICEARDDARFQELKHRLTQRGVSVWGWTDVQRADEYRGRSR